MSDPQASTICDAQSITIQSSDLINALHQAGYGTATQVYTSNGANVHPTFQAATGGATALTFIATATASASATIDFSNNLSATYDNYLVVVENWLPDTNGITHRLRVGTGAGPTYQATNYSGNAFRTSLNVATNASSGTTAIDLNQTTLISNTANRIAGCRIFIHNVNNSSNDKNITTQMDNWDTGGASDGMNRAAGRWQGATVLTSIRFLESSGNISTGTFKLYGITN